MRPLVLAWLSLTNFALGIFYGSTGGPYHLSEGTIASSRDLVSSGSDDAAIIVIALCSFAVTALVAFAALEKPMREYTPTTAYVINYAVYTFLLFLVNLDSSLLKSIQLGDWPLVLALGIPTLTLFLVILSFLRQEICFIERDGPN